MFERRKSSRRGPASITSAVASITFAILIAAAGVVYSAVMQNSGEDRYGTVGIPGQTVVRLPAGRIDLTFTMDLVNQTVAIPVLQMTIEPLAGGAATTVVANIRSPNAVNGVTHVQVATAVIGQAGDYRVSVDGGVSASPNPHLHIGRRTNPVHVLLGALGVAAALLVLGITTVIRSVRGNTSSSG